ncbi:MAG: hypothetical protein FWC48_04635 [Actinomycetia bacterium]|nr:hypothetical protein [Actinomycetes bacterium]
MTVKTISSRLVAALFVAALCVSTLAPAAAPAATPVTAVDKMQVVISLEGTSTTALSMTVNVPGTAALPATVEFNLPGGFKLMDAGEYKDSPTQPTVKTKPRLVSTDAAKALSLYSMTLTKEHNFFVAAAMPVSIYNASAMGGGGVPLALFSVTAATDITDLAIAIAPPAANMVGAGGNSMQTFDAGNNIKLYGQSFKNVKAGETKTVQVAFATDTQAKQGQDAAKKAQAADGFFSQPIVWVLAAVLVIVIVILIFVLMRQRRGMTVEDEDFDEDLDEDFDEDADEDADEDIDADASGS